MQFPGKNRAEQEKRDKQNGTNTMARKRILVLSFTALGSDPRVYRQICALKDHYEVICAGLGDPQLKGVSFIPLQNPRLNLFSAVKAVGRLALRQFERHYWKSTRIQMSLQALRDVRADVVLANDIGILPLALRVSGGSPVLFDAHEYAPEEFSDQWLFRWLFQPYRRYLCRRYIPQTTAMMTVCEAIAQRYARENGVEPVVVLNAPPYEELFPSPGPAEDGPVRLIHHGGACPSRRLEAMIDMMDDLDKRFQLDFMLVEVIPGYVDWLKRRAAANPRIRFRSPVSMQSLARETNRYDLGVYLLPPSNFNNRAALPNKFFEFIQARLGVAIGPSPEMARFVRRYELGLVADEFTPASLAEKLNGLSAADIQRFKQNAHRAARKLSAEESRQVLLDVVQSVVARLETGDQRIEHGRAA